MKSRMPNASGYQIECFDVVAAKVESIAKKPSDWEMSLFWDATGFKKYCWFNKKGELEGFDCNPQSFNTLLMIAKQVINY